MPVLSASRTVTAELPVASALSANLIAVRAFLMRRVRPDDVDDMVQEVALRLHACACADRIVDPHAYLFRIARSVLTDRHRRERVRCHARHEPLAEAHHPVEEISPGRVLEGKQRLGLAMQALAELPERTRDAFVMHRFERISYAGIASHLDVSVSAVEKHIMKALRHLTVRLAD